MNLKEDLFRMNAVSSNIAMRKSSRMGSNHFYMRVTTRKIYIDGKKIESNYLASFSPSIWILDVPFASLNLLTSIWCV